MNKIPRNISRSIARLMPDNWILNRHFPCFLPFYHVVSDEKLPYILNYSYRNAAQFEKELDFYLKHFHAVGLEEIVSESCSGKKVVHLSFDDGLRQCADIIAPILLRKGIPATFFINTAFIDNRELFHRYKASLILSRLREKPDQMIENYLGRNNLAGEKILQATVFQEKILNEVARMLEISFNEFLARKKPYLTSEQVKKLASEGFYIGAHSHTHPEFWKISEAEQINEVKESIARVTQLVNPKIKAFSFPFTDSGVPASVHAAICREAICDITFGTAGIKKDSLNIHLQRYPVEQAGDFKNNLKGEVVYFLLRKWAGKETVIH